MRLKKLHEIALRTEEQFTPDFNLEKVIEEERQNSWRFGGKTVFGDSKPPKGNDGIQLSLF